jgi:hypothetical protein
MTFSASRVDLGLEIKKNGRSSGVFGVRTVFLFCEGEHTVSQLLEAILSQLCALVRSAFG